MFRLEPQTIEFADHAPLRVSDSAVVGAPRGRVFEAFADAGSWHRWFPLMTRSRWTTAETRRVGAERQVSLLAMGTFLERFIVWDADEHMAFTILTSSSPFATGIVESFRFADADGGRSTRVDWVLAARPRLVGKLLKPVLEATMRRVFRGSGPRLESYLKSR
jgi:uncharacterized protein YndB with AHSA1/START domain